MQVLDTYMFHSFLKARLNGRMDAFARMDLDTQSEEDRCLALLEVLFGGLRVHTSISFGHANNQFSGLLSSSPGASKGASSVCSRCVQAGVVCLAEHPTTP